MSCHCLYVCQLYAQDYHENIVGQSLNDGGPVLLFHILDMVGVGDNSLTVSTRWSMVEC